MTSDEWAGDPVGEPAERDLTTQYLSAVEEIHAQIKKVRRELRPSDHIVRDLEIDSLATLELLLALEDRFEVTLLDDPRTAGVETVGDLLTLLQECTAARSRP